MVKSTSTSIAPSRLLSIPPELRLIIYEHCLATFPFNFNQHRQVSRTLNSKQAAKSYKLQPQLLSTCAPIRREALPICITYLRQCRQKIKAERDAEIAAWDRPESMLRAFAHANAPVPLHERWFSKDAAYQAELKRAEKMMEADSE